MLEKMNVWNYEKTYKDMHLEENQVDERNEQVGDKTTELSPLTDLIKESSKNPNVHVGMSSSSPENGKK